MKSYMAKKISEPVETVTILKEMKPEILVKGTKEKPKEKTAPVLTLERTDTNVLDRSANLSYHWLIQMESRSIKLLRQLKMEMKLSKQ